MLLDVDRDQLWSFADAPGYEPISIAGDTASRPQMTIDEFQRLITFATPSHDWRLPMLFPEALEDAHLR